MPSSCVVRGCRRRWNINETRRFYSFPVDPQHRSAWLAAIGRTDFPPATGIKANHCVCSDHFVSGCKRYRKTDVDYVPSLLLQTNDSELSHLGECSELLKPISAEPVPIVCPAPTPTDHRVTVKPAEPSSQVKIPSAARQSTDNYVLLRAALTNSCAETQADSHDILEVLPIDCTKDDARMKCDQESVCKLLRETVGVLCRSGLQFSVGLRVQGLLAVTVDNNDVFIVQFDDLLRPEPFSSETPKQQQDSNIRHTGPQLPGSSAQSYNSSDSHPATIGRQQSQHCQFSQQQVKIITIAPSSNIDSVFTIKDEADDENLSDTYQQSAAYPTDSDSILSLDLKASDIENCNEPEMKFAYSEYGAGDSSFENFNMDIVYADVDDGCSDSVHTKILNLGCKSGAFQGDDLKSLNASAKSSRSCSANKSGKPLFVKKPAARRIISKYRQQKQMTGTSVSSGAPYSDTRETWSTIHSHVGPATSLGSTRYTTNI